MTRITLASLLLSAAPAAMAQDEMTQLGAHVHGAGELAVAMDPDSGELVMEMTGPAYNIYGFERAPQSQAELDRVNAAHAGLLRGDQFAFEDAAGCVWIDTEVTGGPVIDGHDHGQDDGHGHDHDDHGHDDHDHGDHEHGDHHDHDGHDHDEHDHGHHDHHDEHGQDEHGHDEPGHAHGDEHGHSDMLIRWRYTCETPTRFDSVDATVLFDVLPSLTSLDVQFFDGTRADADQINRERRALVID